MIQKKNEKVKEKPIEKMTLRDVAKAAKKVNVSYGKYVAMRMEEQKWKL